MHSFRIQLQKHLPKFDEVTGDGISEIRFDATRIDFFGDAFVAFAVVVAYAVSIPAAPSPPSPPPGYCGAFSHLFSPGVRAFANFALPGGRAFANPWAIPELLTRTRLLSEYNYTEDITRKKADWLICEGQGVQ